MTGLAGANVVGAVGLATFATTANAVAGANVSGQVSFAATANAVAGANVSGQVGNALVAGTVYTAAQPNITSVGTLTSLTASGTITSSATTALTMSLAGTANANLIYASMGDNDQFRIYVGATATNAGFVEIATADDGTEPIYVRQYTGVFTTVARTATLLDSSGHTTFPGNITGANLTTAGTLTAGTVTETSSLALKENFRPIENPLEKVIQLLGKIYDRKDGSSKDEAGLVAEDVYKIIPNLVKTDANGNPESVFYTRLTVYLLESIKVLNDEIADLKGKKRKSKK